MLLPKSVIGESFPTLKSSGIPPVSFHSSRGCNQHTVLNDVNPGGCHLYASHPENKQRACFFAFRAATEVQLGGTEAAFLPHPSPYDDSVKYQSCMEDVK